MIRAAVSGLIAALAIAFASPVAAQADLFSRQTLSGLVDLRLAAADGERSWTDGGYGKGRYSGAGDGLRITPELAEAALVWKPRFSWSLGGVVHVQAQPDQAHVGDVVEAYLAYKPAPRSAWRYSLRAGLFFPPISMEHEDPAWGVTHTITPSAINSWVGEEVKTLGLEASLRRAFGAHELGVTAAVFDDNDTSGTLLALRGWALHDLKGTAFGDFPLPKLKPVYRFIWRGQAPDTEPSRRLDQRLGGYGRLDWKTGPLAANLFYYDNGGNRIAVSQGQWSWRTRFWNLGASLDLDDRTRLISQVMKGSTLEGYSTPRGLWIDVDFTSAYLLATRRYGRNGFTARVDWFETADNSFQDRDDNTEHGWALTGAWRYDVSSRATLLVEAMHVTSDRFARNYIGVAPDQDQTTLQAALRLHF